MASLYNVTEITRKILEWITIVIVAFVGIFLLFQMGTFVKELISPTPLPAPTVAFGKIPLQSFPPNALQTTYTYTINTLDGKLPALPDRINVYKFQQPLPSLLNADKAKSMAFSAGFTTDPTILSDTNYQWTKTDPFPMQLNIDTQSLDFSLTSSYASNGTVTSAPNLPNEQDAQQAVNTYFNNVLPLPASVDPTKTKTTFFAIQNGQLIGASSLSLAQIIRIDFFPKALDNLPIYSLDPDKSLLYALVASSDTEAPQIVEASYYHKDASDQKATYPIISVEDAYKQLQNGNAYIALNTTGNTAINITNVSLGYYVDNTPEEYLWPIIVFQGDQGFYAYVSALQEKWIQK